MDPHGERLLALPTEPSILGTVIEGRMDDSELAGMIAQGCSEAWRTLAARHHAPAYRLLLHLTGRREDAEDLAQATLLRVWRGIGTYDGRAPLRAWILGIAWNEFGRWRRMRPWMPLLGERPSEEPGFRRAEESQRLAEALRSLTPPLRAAFLLCSVEQLSIAEAAAALSVPEGTIKRRLHDARARLRELLETP
ncbi:RNA polymerase sigma factor [bacterium]|nr:MAG: RNA polymerase sigma factor [bacterium]